VVTTRTRSRHSPLTGTSRGALRSDLWGIDRLMPLARAAPRLPRWPIDNNHPIRRQRS
jgi:hypothetical protein